jgi:hypothetical protein
MDEGNNTTMSTVHVDVDARHARRARARDENHLQKA